MQAALRERSGGPLSHDNIKNIRSLLPGDTQQRDIARFLEVSICDRYAQWFLHAARFPVHGGFYMQQGLLKMVVSTCSKVPCRWKTSCTAMYCWSSYVFTTCDSTVAYQYAHHVLLYRASTATLLVFLTQRYWSQMTVYGAPGWHSTCAATCGRPSVQEQLRGRGHARESPSLQKDIAFCHCNTRYHASIKSAGAGLPTSRQHLVLCLELDCVSIQGSTVSCTSCLAWALNAAHTVMTSVLRYCSGRGAVEADCGSL